jgi:hypothetical protein
VPANLPQIAHFKFHWDWPEWLDFSIIWELICDPWDVIREKFGVAWVRQIATQIMCCHSMDTGSSLIVSGATNRRSVYLETHGAAGTRNRYVLLPRY